MISRLYNWIERQSIPGINWFKTIYLNFRMLPFKQAKRFPVLVYGNPALNSLSGKIKFDCPIKKGLVKINKQETFAPSLQTGRTQICIYGSIVIKGEVLIGCGTKILVAHSGILTLYNNTRISDFCNIDCWSQITIGEESRIAHRCQIMDSNHHYILDEDIRKIPNNSKSVTIGKYCWICNSSSVLPGAVIPDYSIVSSYSIVNKDISSWGNHIIVGGIPVKLLKTNVARIFNKSFELDLCEYFNKGKKGVYDVPLHVDINPLIQNNHE